MSRSVSVSVMNLILHWYLAESISGKWCHAIHMSRQLREKIHLWCPQLILIASHFWMLVQRCPTERCGERLLSIWTCPHCMGGHACSKFTHFALNQWIWRMAWQSFFFHSCHTELKIATNLFLFLYQESEIPLKFGPETVDPRDVAEWHLLISGTDFTKVGSFCLLESLFLGALCHL